jgi:hypothetical protein
LFKSTEYLSNKQQNDVFEFTLNKAGYLEVDLYGTSESDFADIDFSPKTCDWDFYVNAGNFCGSESVYIARSATNVQCDDSATGYSLAGNSYVKVHRNSGGGSATINVQLLECVADSTLDAACPAEKSLCHNNKCVECYSNDLNTGDSNEKNDRSSICIAKDPTKPQCILSGALQFTCQAPEPCSINADCPAYECCRAEIGIQPFTCVPNPDKQTRIYNPYLCT